MSSLMDLLQSSIKRSSIGEISRTIGSDERSTSDAIDRALPMLIGALQRSTAQDGGEGLARALAKKHDGSILEDLAGFVDRDDRSDGRGILRHILGPNRDAAAMLLGEQSGIGEGKASALMATLAPMVMGALGKARTQKRLAGDDLARLLTDESNSLRQRSPAAMGAVAELLDADGDGDTDLGDLLRHGAKRFGGFLR